MTHQPLTDAHPSQRNRPRLALRRLALAPLVLLASLAAVPGLLLAAALPALAAPEEIVLADEAGVIHEPTLREELAGVNFHEPTTVVIWTERGAEDSNLNERLLAYARAEHPEWISEDGQKWADGLFIYAIDPEGRQQGVYFGEDRAVSQGTQDSIREDAVEALQEADWTDAAVDATESAAAVMNRPWYQHPGVWVAGAVGVGTVGIVAGTVVATRRKQRRQAAEDLQRGNASFTNVTTDLEATELNAHTVPEDSRYGAQVLERYRTFHERYLKAARANDTLNAVPEKELHRKEHREAIARYLENTTALDQLDDTVASSNTLLNQYPGWTEAWDVQTAPLREDLDRIPELTEGQSSMRQVQLTPLQSFRSEAARELERLGAGLQTGELSPDEALDGLAGLRERLTELLSEFARAQVDAFAESEEEKAQMLETMQAERNRVTHRPGSILDTVHTPGWVWTAAAYSIGFNYGQSSVVSAREQAASSGSTTGYGASGGSFSGAGSSSSF